MSLVSYIIFSLRTEEQGAEEQGAEELKAKEAFLIEIRWVFPLGYCGMRNDAYDMG